MKSSILNHAKVLVDERVKIAQDAMDAAQQSANGEGKSSAGDKYETARAMGQIERDMYAHQYELAKQDRAILEKIDANMSPPQVTTGSLVETSSGVFFISVSVGKLVVEGKTYFGVSPQSPIGALLMGKKKGETFQFQGKIATVLGLS